MAARRHSETAALRDGVITALVTSAGQADRVAVHLDGRRAFDLSSAVADRAGLRAGDPLSAERQERLIAEDAPSRARCRALRLLALRDRSRRETETRLRQAGFEAAVVGETLEWLADLGYVDDRRFASLYASEKQRRGWGPRRIRVELAAKGVERSIVEEVVAALVEAEEGRGDQADGLLEQTTRRRFAAQFAADPDAAERRLAGFLLRRGYDWETVGRLARLLRTETGPGGEETGPGGEEVALGKGEKPDNPSIP